MRAVAAAPTLPAVNGEVKVGLNGLEEGGECVVAEDVHGVVENLKVDVVELLLLYGLEG